MTADGSAVDEPLVRCVGLTKHFPVGSLWHRRRLHAVDDLSLEIGHREIVALVGESGSGKSTVARLLSMLYRPTQGEVEFDGQYLSSVRGRREQLEYRRKVRMVFQDPFSFLNPAYRISHGLVRAASLHRPELSRWQQREEVIRVLDVVGLSPAEELIERFPHELSGGQRQRVGFAEALISRPQLIIADEPVSMLDVSIRIGLLNLMAGLRDKEGVSILYITHDIASAWYVADRVAVMYAGRVVEQGPADLVLRTARHPYTQLLLSAVPDPRVELSVDEAEVSDPPRVIDPDDGCRFRTRCPWVESRCALSTPTLVTDGTAQEVACFVANEGIAYDSDAGAQPGVAPGARDVSRPTSRPMRASEERHGLG